MNTKYYNIQKHFFESCLRYVFPAKRITFTQDISTNDMDAVNHQLFELGMVGDQNIEASHLQLSRIE